MTVDLSNWNGLIDYKNEYYGNIVNSLFHVCLKHTTNLCFYFPNSWLLFFVWFNFQKREAMLAVFESYNIEL